MAKGVAAGDYLAALQAAAECRSEAAHLWFRAKLAALFGSLLRGAAAALTRELAPQRDAAAERGAVDLKSFVEDARAQLPHRLGLYRACRGDDVAAMVLPSQGRQPFRHWGTFVAPSSSVPGEQQQVGGAADLPVHVARACCTGCRQGWKLQLRVMDA